MRTRIKLKIVVVIWVIIFSFVLFASERSQAQELKKIRLDKPKFRVSVCKSSNRTCYILFKKRTATLKHPFFSFPKNPKYKPMAETNQPNYRISAAK